MCGVDAAHELALVEAEADRVVGLPLAEATEPAEVSDDNSGRSNGDGRGSGKGNGNEG
jgi:hypothetical protein